MNMDSFDMILTIAALVMGVMLLTGHGDILMKGGNAAERKKLYDDKKVQAGFRRVLCSFSESSPVWIWWSRAMYTISFIWQQ